MPWGIPGGPVSVGGPVTQRRPGQFNGVTLAVSPQPPLPVPVAPSAVPISSVGGGVGIEPGFPVEGGIAIGGLLPLLAKWGPALLGLLGGTALGGLFGGGEGEEGMPSGETPLGEGFKMPWETPAGEGFIAPWTEQVMLPNGEIGQLGKAYPALNIAYSWATGTAVFFRLTDGRIAVQKKNGVWKIYRPKKHIVLSTNPRLSQLRKFDRAYTRLNKMVTKFKGKPKRVTIAPPLKYLSPAERSLVKAGG